jgi:hypothetical protein
VFILYLGIILFFAVLYRYIPGIVEIGDWSFLKSVYFSVITITTLGYGEITPKSEVGMVLTSIEAIIGIVIIGLFLNSLWHAFTRRIEDAQDKSVANRLSEQNLHSLASYYQYLSAVIGDYQVAAAELTTPMSERKGKLEPDLSFKFSDLQDMYKQSLLTKSGFSKPVIHLYFEKLDFVISEFKFLLVNFDLLEYPSLHKRMIDFLTLSKAQDIRDALFSYEKIGGGGKLLKEDVEEMIKEHESCPDLEKYQSNVITPVILLYHTLKSQIMQIKLISEEFEKIMANKKLQPTAESGG